MSAWGTKWIMPDKPAITSEGKPLPDDWHTHTSDELYLGWDLAPKPDQTAYVVLEANKFRPATEDEIKIIEDADKMRSVNWPEDLVKAYASVRNNLVPTHDPYTNPGAYLYYECKCGAVLDPKVKRFAALNDAASEAGWKVRWGAQYYVPYCVECGKGVE